MSPRSESEGRRKGHQVDWKIFLSATAIAFAVLEVISAFFIEAPVVAILFAALFVLGAWLLRRFATVGVVVLAVLFVIELAGLPFYPRADTADRVTQTLALVIAIAGVVGVVGVIRQRRLARPVTA